MSKMRRPAVKRAVIVGVCAAAVGSIASAVLSVAAADQLVKPLSMLCIDKAGTSISGVSSGGFLAHQYHLAHSASLIGAGIFAAGPYQCAGTDYPWTLFRALTVCANFLGPVPFLGPPDVGRTITAARWQAQAGAIDDPAGLANDRVLLFSGRLDSLVPRPVVTSVAEFYRSMNASVRLAQRDDVDAAHAMITDTYGNACDSVATPYINACGFDLAGATLHHIYGSLSPPVAAIGQLFAFDQRDFVEAGQTHGLATQGYAYFPSACTTEHSGCRVHVALHGCLQSAEAIADAFIRHAGYNEWAESNRLIILYPQAANVMTRVFGIDLPWPNPQGCWDWWGFTGDDFASKAAPQIRAIHAMIERLSGACPEADAAPSD